MVDSQKYLEKLVDKSLTACQSWLTEDSADGLRMIDPVDQKVVVSHYGDSHLAAALILLGQLRREKNLIQQGLQIVQTIVGDWATSTKFVDFHHDFNHFALCLIVENIGDIAPELAQEISSMVLATRDSNHETINWLPMRAYVNFCRYEWSGEERYFYAAERALAKVSSATNADGGIEDRLPKGTSYNLQYHITSLASLQLLSSRRPHSKIETGHCHDFLHKRVLPDGDINYCGRGTNQIFAWGPWLYLLASSGNSGKLALALQFLENRYSVAAANRNILLNSFLGPEKSFWWDYHHCSVYHAHFLLWSVLAMRDFSTTRTFGVEGSGKDTGLECISGASGGAAIFSGRSIYLAEAGPAICALWISERGILFKGGLGPSQGMFGKLYSFADIVLQNHFGLISQEPPRRLVGNQIKRRLGIIYEEERSVLTRPIFTELCVTDNPRGLDIEFKTSEPMSAYLNVPIFDEQMGGIKLEMSVDGSMLSAIQIAKSRSQYGWISVNRSLVAYGKVWKLSVRKN